MISLMNQRYRRMGRPWGSRFLVLLLGLSAGGCGGSYGQIEGKVFYKGQPLTGPGAIVTFMDANGGTFSSSVASDGRYAIAKIPTGQVKIAVLVLPPRRTDGLRQAEQAVIRSGKLDLSPEYQQKISQNYSKKGFAAALPSNYADPEKSGLVHTVTGGKQTHDIELR